MPIRRSRLDRTWEERVNARHYGLVGHPQAYDPSFGPDGERLAFLAENPDEPCAYVLDQPQGWPRPLTQVDRRVVLAKWSPTREVLLIGTTTQDSETVSFSLLDDGLDPLTDDTDASHRFGGWSHGGQRFAFTANRRDESSFDVYVQDIDTSEADLVYQTDGWFDVLGWSPDDDALALKETRSGDDVALHVLSLSNGSVRQVTPANDKARFWSVNWGPEGESFYLVTDYGADTSYVARLPFETRELEPVIEPAKWNVDGVNVHTPTGRLAYGLNVEGYTELVLGELSSPIDVEETWRPDGPDGVMGEVTFSPNGERIAMTVSTRTAVPNIYVVSTTTGAVERWTDATIAGVHEPSLVEPTVVQFESFDGLAVHALYSIPPDAEPGRTPVVVDIHGGPAKQRRPSFSGRVQALLGAGYAVFEPNVRGSTGYGAKYRDLDNGRRRADVLRDIRAGVEWLQDQPAVDPGRIVAHGGSYGGFVALASVCEDDDLWAGGVSISGITDLVAFLENASPLQREMREGEYGSLEEDREFLESISPIENVAEANLPLLVIHSENDPRIQVSDTRQFLEVARSHDVEVESLVLEDEAHAITGTSNKLRIHDTVLDFLDRTVGQVGVRE